VSVADFYLAFSWGKVKECVEESLYSLGFPGINFSREFSDLFLTSSTSPKLHRLGVQKGFWGHRKFTGKSQENQ
jgi:hypothetical protein